MDIHRSRFVPYPTSAISALAFSRSSDSGYTHTPPALKLAIGRSNGDIEIWNPQNGSWVQEAVFTGDIRSIDGLAWTQDPDEADAEGKRIPGQQRLFSIASSPSVTEWDLATGVRKRESTGNFSEVWCFAAQPRSKEKDLSEAAPAQEIVAGCGDGTLVLLSTADNDLQFKRFLARVGGKRARCMCVAYQTRERIAAGFADAMIRIYDTRNGTLLRGMSLGASLPGMPKNAMVWQVKCLPNGDIVTGDSNGEVRFWDGKTYSLSQRLAGHETDCLDLVTSADGRTVFSGSIDGKIAIYKQSGQDGGRKAWARSSHRRLHNGEVKAMAAFDSKTLSVVVSGGSDVAPMVAPLREYGKENPRALPTLPQQPPIVSAPRARLMASWWARTISIWRIARQRSTRELDEPANPRRMVAKMTLDIKEHIRCVSMSPNGRLIAAASNAEVKVFQLRKRAGSDGLAIRKLSIPRELSVAGARLLTFSPDGKWLASVTPDSEVYVARLNSETENPKRLQMLGRVVELDRRHRKTAAPSSLKSYDQSIARIAFATDSSVLVASDMSGYLDSWVLKGHEDLTAPATDTVEQDSHKSSAVDSDSDSDSDSSSSDDGTTVFYGQHWTDNPSGHLLPRLDSAPLLLTFRPAQPQQALTNGNPGLHPTRHNPHAHSHELPQGQHRLFVLTAEHQMYELDVLTGRFSDWSRRNPTSALPEDFRKIRDRAMGGVWDVSGAGERLWIYGASFLGMLRVDVDGEVGSGGVGGQSAGKKRRKAKDGEAGRDGGDAEEAAKRRKLGSGAGSSINRGLLDHAFEEQQQARAPSKLARREDTRTDDDSKYSEADDDDEDGDIGLLLTHLRDDEGQQQTKTPPGGPRWWCSFKYRPILGMVPISESGDDGERPLEVVLVERPAWEAQQEGRKKKKGGARVSGTLG